MFKNKDASVDRGASCASCPRAIMAEPWAPCEKCHQGGRRSVPCNMLTIPAFLNAEPVAWGETWLDSALEGVMHIPSACWAQS